MKNPIMHAQRSLNKSDLIVKAHMSEPINVSSMGAKPDCEGGVKKHGLLTNPCIR